MKACLTGIIILMFGLNYAEPSSMLNEILYGRDLDLGPYSADVEIGELPDRYPNITGKDVVAGYSVRRLLEQLRGSMPTGIFDIPSLDPYINNKLSPISINAPFLSGEIDVRQVMVTGLQAFKIDLMEVRLDTVRADFAFCVPLLNGSVSFQTNLALTGLFQFNINGKLRMKLQNVTVEGAVGGNENISPAQKYFNFTSLQVHLHAMNVEVRLDGLNLDRDVVDSLQSLVDSLDSSLALEPAKKVVNLYAAQEILKQLNRIVQNFSVEQIKSYLLAR